MVGLALLLLELLETDNDVVGGGVDPAALGHKGGANGLELGVVEYPLGRALDVDHVAGLD